MNVKQLSKYHGIVRLDDWAGLDRTGATDMSSRVQAWQDQAFADKRVAVAPPGVFGLNTKVLFKAPTVGAGGAAFGRPDNTTAPVAHTTFKNLAINDNSWMIDVITSSVAADEQYAFGLLKGFRCHAGGLNCSLMRVRGVESVPAGFALEKFLWDDIIGYGGWVNFEHYGYGGEIRNVYSRAARLSAFRAYLCNALRVNGGWFGASGTGAWEFEVFGRAGGSDYEGSHGIIFNQPVFQSQPDGTGSNGLRISENVRQVKIAAYFEDHVPVGGVGGVAFQAGWNSAVHASGTIPTEVNIATTDAPSNDLRLATAVIDFTGSTGGGSATNRTIGSRFMFNNVRGVRWGRSGIGGRSVEYTARTHDIEGYTTPPNGAVGIPSLSGLGGVTTTGAVSAGATLVPMAGVPADTTDKFDVGVKVYLQLVDIEGKNPLHETTVDTKVAGVSVTMLDAVPTGRSAISGALFCHNKMERLFNGLSNIDALHRGGITENLLPPGNFIGTVSTATGGGLIHGAKEADTSFASALATIATDYNVRRNGRPTLKVTRDGVAVPGSSVPRFWIFPYGSSSRSLVGIPIVVSGWCMTEDVVPYNSTTFTLGSDWDQPGIGITVFDGVGNTHVAPPAAFTGFGSYVIPGQWYHFLYTFTFNDPNITKVGINFLPAQGNFTWGTIGSCWFDSLGIFVNPRSYQDIIDGNYSHNPAAGYFDENGKFEVRCAAVPTMAKVQCGVGDRFISNVGTIGQPKAWTVTTAGPATTAVFTSEGNL